MRTFNITELAMKDIITGLEHGMENTQALLIDHDTMLGRSTKKNKIYAEILEQEIKEMNSTIKTFKGLI